MAEIRSPNQNVVDVSSTFLTNSLSHQSINTVRFSSLLTSDNQYEKKFVLMVILRTDLHQKQIEPTYSINTVCATSRCRRKAKTHPWQRRSYKSKTNHTDIRHRHLNAHSHTATDLASKLPLLTVLPALTARQNASVPSLNFLYSVPKALSRNTTSYQRKTSSCDETSVWTRAYQNDTHKPKATNTLNMLNLENEL